MEVHESEAFVLHEKAITTFADMARNLNPLSNQDFHDHRNDVIKWVAHSGRDDYLAKQLKNAKNKERFVELLALRHSKDLAKYAKKTEKTDHNKELAKVEKKLKEVDKEISTPKKLTKDSKEFFEFDVDDFNKLVEEALHLVEQKHYKEAVLAYKTLKRRFEYSNLHISHKKQIHKKIKEVYLEIAKFSN